MRAYVAEVIGTFFLCFAGIAAILSTQDPINSGAGILGIALAHGLALSVAVNAFGGVSGAHFNPAVTIGFLATGRICPPRAVCYIVAQLLGASIAALACNFIFPPEAVNSAHLGIPLPAPWISPEVLLPTVLVAEFIMTFLLMTAIFGTAVDERGKAVKIGAFGIGLTVTFDILAGGAVTGASMNPARSFGPAFIQAITGNENAWDHHLLYWIAPVVGAVVAALLYHHIILESEDEG